MTSLKNFKILIADSDMQLAMVSKLMLKGMGFHNIDITSNGRNALDIVKKGGIDFVITDWNLKGMDGIELIQHIRRDTDSPNPTLPVIMLTGRMEESDVQAARDNGIHEYVIKPFTAQTIYARLERIVDFPSYFIVSNQFVGPERRRRKLAPANNRRSEPLLPQSRPTNPASAISTLRAPSIWMPDYTLKHKLGRDVTLNSIITPALLQQAQESIDAATPASRAWIRDDVATLQALCAQLATPPHAQSIGRAIVDVALTISARSGTFGFKDASTVAYMLYLFARKVLRPSSAAHRVVLEKHIDVLQIMFAQNIDGNDKNIPQIITELKNLTAKCS